MKKFIIALALAAFIGGCAFSPKAMAQDVAKQHLSFSLSDNLVLATGTALGGAVASVFTAPLGCSLGDVNSYGCWNLSYDHPLGGRFNLGADLSCALVDMNFKDNGSGSVVSESSVGFLMLMVSGRLDYIRKSHFTFYGDIAAGPMAAVSDETSYSLAFQVNPVGLRFGGKVGGFLEIGFGMRGIVTAGVDIAF